MLIQKVSIYNQRPKQRWCNGRMMEDPLTSCTPPILPFSHTVVPELVSTKAAGTRLYASSAKSRQIPEHSSM